MDKKDDLEVRFYYHGELLCPNPMKTYQMTRSYESLKAEYDLLHAGELDEFDLLKLEAALLQSRSSAILYLLPSILFITLGIIFLVRCYV